MPGHRAAYADDRAGVDPVTLRALAALYRAAGATKDGPIDPGWGTWVLLSYLYAQRGGSKAQYRGYWAALKEPMDYLASEHARAYCRPTYARTAWNRLCHGLGVRQDIEFMAAISEAAKEGES